MVSPRQIIKNDKKDLIKKIDKIYKMLIFENLDSGI